MQVIVNIPDFKFKVGDIVYLKNKNNTFGIYFKIINFACRLSAVRIDNNFSQYAPRVEDASYSAEFMPGSYTDSAEPDPLVGYTVLPKWDIEQSIYVNHNPDLTFLYTMSDTSRKINSIRDSQIASGIELLKSFRKK